MSLTFHQALGDGALSEQGIRGDHPSLQEKTAQDVFQGGDFVRLIRHGLLPHGQPCEYGALEFFDQTAWQLHMLKSLERSAHASPEELLS
jgi:hypothetical protein